MSKNIQAIRGMRDILPVENVYWQYLEKKIQELMQAYGYQNIRFPILEKTELFKRSIGEVTDIVEKEMYSFLDRNGDSLSLRPEGTACCIRAAVENGLLYHQVQRLWYLGPMFRHERPQNGRYRQFYHWGVEVFGIAGPAIDAELILMTYRLWKQLGLQDQIVLEINSLGTQAVRAKYRQRLVDYLTPHIDQLDEDCRRRLQTNPLRILDSKNPELQKLIANAPTLFEDLGTESLEHFEQLRYFLDEAGVPYRMNPRLVRGLDYYSETVFEWVTEQLGSQGTVCAGGRYDTLVTQLGGPETFAVGFALGMERVIALLQQQHPKLQGNIVDAYLITLDKNSVQQGLLLAEKLREALPNLRLLNHGSAGSLKSQFKAADKSGATFAIILGEEEIQTKVISIKYLRVDQTQQKLTFEELVQFFGEQHEYLYDRSRTDRTI